MLTLLSLVVTVFALLLLVPTLVFVTEVFVVLSAGAGY